MSHTQRFKKLLELEKLNASRFCRVINYTLKNLGNYLNGVTSNPSNELIVGILKHYPHWNIRYWLLGEGEPLLGDDQIKIVHETIEAYQIEDSVVKELTAQLAYLRKENQQKDEELKKLKGL